jgi:Leucine-rich repeat (LRR) protein
MIKLKNIMNTEQEDLRIKKLVNSQRPTVFEKIFNFSNKKTILELSREGISSLPDVDLNCFHEIYFHHNHLTEVPDSLRSAERLEKLGFRGNEITELPLWITDLKYLSILENCSLPQREKT